MTAQKCVLVVEDSSTIQNFISRALSDLKYFVVLAGSIEDALRINLRDKIHVALVDLILPGMGGVAGIPKILGKWPNAGVIAMSGASTGDGPDALLASAREAGAHALLRKPFTAAQLGEKIDRLLNDDFGEETRKRRVLVVEDSRTVRKLVCGILTRAGMDVLEAGSMEEALGSPDILAVDLVVSDIFMPGLGGIEGIQIIKKNWPRVPVIAISGSIEAAGNSERALLAAERIGADLCLKKPFSEADLLRGVGRLLGAPELSAAFDGQGDVVDREIVG